MLQKSPVRGLQTRILPLVYATSMIPGIRKEGCLPRFMVPIPSLAEVLVSCDGNGFSDELIQSLPSLWTEEQQAWLQGLDL